MMRKETKLSKHHFIITFDTDTKRWAWDTETESAVFTEGTIYVDDMWVHSGNIIETDEVTYGIDEQGSEVLGHMLRLVNVMFDNDPVTLTDKAVVSEMDGVS